MDRTELINARRRIAILERELARARLEAATLRVQLDQARDAWGSAIDALAEPVVEALEIVEQAEVEHAPVLR